MSQSATVRVNLLTVPLFGRFNAGVAVANFQVPSCGANFVCFYLRNGILFRLVDLSFGDFDVVIVVLTEESGGSARRRRHSVRMFLRTFVPLSFLVGSSYLPSQEWYRTAYQYSRIPIPSCHKGKS